jgi:GTP cyclohydrolase II
MIGKVKDSKNAADTLAEAVSLLRRQNGLVIKQKNGKKIAVYPTEFFNKKEQQKYPLSDSPILIKLAKRAGLLPALSIIPVNKITSSWTNFSETELEKQLELTGYDIFETARAKLPIKDAEDSTIVSFREQGEEAIHLAFIIGKAKSNKTPLVRVHSSCLTGDLLGSLRCDCGDQLKLALATIKSEGYGILLYLNQEGRGIGITNKLRAYKLQEQGMDTYSANHELGFENDERDFNTAASMLKALGISKINLLTNNPHKVSEIRKHGIMVSKRIPVIAGTNKHNRAYIEAKSKKAGHIIK